MNITNAQYDDNDCIVCLIDGIKSVVPKDPDNRHYAEILRQVKEGTLTIKDAEE